MKQCESKRKTTPTTRKPVKYVKSDSKKDKESKPVKAVKPKAVKVVKPKAVKPKAVKVEKPKAIKPVKKAKQAKVVKESKIVKASSKPVNVIKKKVKSIAKREQPIRSHTRGWRMAVPTKGKERKEMLRVCGKKCFLKPVELKYPVCAYGSCEVDCHGLYSAKIRSAQYKDKKVYKRAIKSIREYKC